MSTGSSLVHVQRQVLLADDENMKVSHLIQTAIGFNGWIRKHCATGSVNETIELRGAII